MRELKEMRVMKRVKRCDMREERGVPGASWRERLILCGNNTDWPPPGGFRPLYNRG